MLLFVLITTKRFQILPKGKDFWMSTYRSWSWVGHLACELCPLILGPLLVQEISLKSPNDILHSVNAHRRAVQNITEDKQKQKERSGAINSNLLPACRNKSRSLMVSLDELWWPLSKKLNEEAVTRSRESLWLFLNQRQTQSSAWMNALLLAHQSPPQHIPSYCS